MDNMYFEAFGCYMCVLSSNFSNSIPFPLCNSPMDDGEQESDKRHNRRRSPEPKWFTKFLSFQATAFFSPFSMAFESYRRTSTAAAAVESKVLSFPAKVTRGTIQLGKKLGVGIIGALHVAVVLTGVMILAGILGVGLVRIWVEEPVVFKDGVLFDYSELNPKAVFDFGGVSDNYGLIGIKRSNKQVFSVPIGHTFHVCLELLLPESDYNRHVGVFQLNAELLSENGAVIAKSSQPCILKYRSLPIRLIRTCIMSIPLVLGLSAETQKMWVQIINHKEGFPRTNAIRVTLIPRPGTSFLPQIYESKILIKSKLPWTKQLVRNWRWTISVWLSLYIYIMLVLFLLGFCRPLLFPIGTMNFTENNEESETGKNESEELERRTDVPEEREVLELLKKWQLRRGRKEPEMTEHSDSSEDAGLAVEEDVAAVGSSSATSVSFTRDDRSVFSEEDSGCVGSVCSDD